jgi:murein L,D-transpeptidase YcbB/YkuD
LPPVLANARSQHKTENLVPTLETICCLVNYDRWLPYQPEGEFIAVNIPEFRLHVFDGEKKVFSIDIVVGKAAHNTVIFADELQYVVFSLYWNIPPALSKKRFYLQ